MRFLLVEDDIQLRELFMEKLSYLFPAVVETACSGNEAIKLLKKEVAYDVIVSDYVMEDGSGVDLLKFKVKSKIAIPFIFFTSTISPSIPFSSDEYMIIEKSKFPSLCTEIKRLLKDHHKFESISYQ